ncbi:hypothetical protein K491DRAFT_723741 [Lophiostoma macrostomum CBS 122681]|uniref:Uncharacterized protein n=1 Tax=Lophiostoma macrostomum CBS 122681 TaxID=1314788 RepID=A0A6A6SJA7_9PLEO|nr:hypothetical protein K491DRAFT_723741 [Lophiostoma macrostomum CBS 122681]
MTGSTLGPLARHVYNLILSSRDEDTHSFSDVETIAGDCFPAYIRHSITKPYDIENLAFLIRQKCGVLSTDKLDVISFPFINIYDEKGNCIKQRAAVTVHQGTEDFVVIVQAENKRPGKGDILQHLEWEIDETIARVLDDKTLVIGPKNRDGKKTVAEERTSNELVDKESQPNSSMNNLP